MPPHWIFSVTSTFLYRANLPWLKWMTNEWSAAHKFKLQLLVINRPASCSLQAQTKEHKIAFSHNSAQVLFSSSWLLSPVNLYLPCMCALSRVWLFVTPLTVAHQAPWDSPGKNIGVGCISSSQGSSWPRDQTCISCIYCIEGRFSTCWAIREAQTFTYTS